MSQMRLEDLLVLGGDDRKEIDDLWTLKGSSKRFSGSSVLLLRRKTKIVLRRSRQAPGKENNH